MEDDICFARRIYKKKIVTVYKYKSQNRKLGQ